MTHPLKDASGRMSEQEIFRHSPEIKKSGEDWKKMYAQVHKLLDTNQVRGIRHGNSLFFYLIEEPKKARIFFVNADVPKNFLRNLQEFAKAMHAAGFTSVYGFTDDLPTVRAIQHLGYNAVIEDTGLHPVHHQTYKVSISV